ncbi:MAG: branched-chain amino acid ABC transporter ATP-binding protein [Candidatus Rokubacteria bacterium 13_1_40CM_68_15]|nr:MAG: branched-chain amino acid ABC transporter ATP-binding protein [Candidatus Rokubacteria bacterium 13_1_40CM_68_15]
MTPDALLAIERLDVAYGEIQVLWEVDLEIARGEVVALLGPNGAGKTTLLRAVAGLLRPRAGRIVWDGAPLDGVPASRVVARGLALVPEGRRLFAGMTVAENLTMGAYRRTDGRAAVSADLEWVFELFPELAARRRQQAGALSGGEQQMCAIGRGLMTKPRLLMLDELSLGLSPVAVDRIVAMLAAAHRTRGMAMLIVEQDVRMALELARRAYILETGRITRGDEARRLIDDPRVKKAYLGL